MSFRESIAYIPANKENREAHLYYDMEDSKFYIDNDHCSICLSDKIGHREMKLLLSKLKITGGWVEEVED